MSFKVGPLAFSRDSTPVVVPEIGINHGGSLKVAKQLARLAMEHGAKLVKHQTHIPDAEMSAEAKTIKPGNSDNSIYDVISQNSLDEKSERELLDYCSEIGIQYFSTPFSREAADRLEAWGVPLYKIGSGECNNYPLVSHIASFGKPIILSTGMNSLASVQKSVEILEKSKVSYALMHTTNLYPTPSRLVRLGGLTALADAFPNAVVGLSDHTTSNASCVASVALGATILERHFTDTRDRVGPDIPCSMTPAELESLIEDANQVFLALGGRKEAAPEEGVTMRFAFASVVATKELKPGDILSQDNIWIKRPAGGDFGPEELDSLLGRAVATDIPFNTQIKQTQLR